MIWLLLTHFFRNPIADYPFYVLVETHGSDDVHDGEKLSRFLSKEMESGLIVDGTVTSEPSKMQVCITNNSKFWICVSVPYPVPVAYFLLYKPSFYSSFVLATESYFSTILDNLESSWKYSWSWISSRLRLQIRRINTSEKLLRFSADIEKESWWQSPCSLRLRTRRLVTTYREFKLCDVSTTGSG